MRGRPRATIPNERAQAVRAALASGEDMARVAKRFGITALAVYDMAGARRGWGVRTEAKLTALSKTRALTEEESDRLYDAIRAQNVEVRP